MEAESGDRAGLQLFTSGLSVLCLNELFCGQCHLEH